MSVGTQPKAAMNDGTSAEAGPQLYVRRLRNPYATTRFIPGKLYKVQKSLPTSISVMVHDDTGREWIASDPTLWQFVWLLPDGTELEALP